MILPGTASAASDTFEVPPQLVETQLQMGDNVCSAGVLDKHMATDIARYWNYSGKPKAEVAALSRNAQGAIDILVAIESDFIEHGADLPIEEQCGVDYRKLRQLIGA